MTYKEFVKTVSKEASIPQTKVNEVLSTATYCILKVAKSQDTVTIPAFGKFSVKKTKGVTFGKKPYETNLLKFKQSTIFKKLLND